MCADMGVTLLGRVPLDPALARAAEAGRPVFETHLANGIAGASPRKVMPQPALCLSALHEIVEKVLGQLLMKEA